MDAMVALITGCSTGIGRDLATRMTAAGYVVVATARRGESLDGLEVALNLALDVTSDESVTAAIAQVMEAYGRIDVLVNNAGYGVRGVIEELPAAAVRAMFDVNVFGALRLMQAVIPHMRVRGSGTIVNISSVAGRLSLPIIGAYSATKFALEALSDAARQELRPFGIHVVVVEPGNIATHFDTTSRTVSAAVLAHVPESPYRDAYRRDAAMGARLHAGQPGPDAVSRVVLNALAARHPRGRYGAAAPWPVAVLFHMSAGLRDRLIALGYTMLGKR